MAEILGTSVNIPSVDVSGFLANTWIYVAIVAFIGLVLLVTMVLVLFFVTYNRKIVFFENISGKGYFPAKKTRARLISLGNSGEEILKTLAGGKYLSAYGRKMGPNSYWYAKGQDGYWYNISLGDLDAKLSILDIEPVDRDVRMFHAALDRIAQNTYGEKRGFLEKFGVPILFLIIAIVMMVGFYLTAGQIKDGLQASNNPSVAEANKETATILRDLTTRLDVISRASGGSGLASAT